MTKNKPVARACLRIMGKGLDLNEITRHLGIEPTYSHKEFDLGRFRRPYTQDMWSLDSPLENHRELNSHLRWLAKILKPHHAYLRSLRKTAKMDIFCSYTQIGQDGGLSIAPKSLSIITELNIRLEISIIALMKR